MMFLFPIHTAMNWVDLWFRCMLRIEQQEEVQENKPTDDSADCSYIYYI